MIDQSLRDQLRHQIKPGDWQIAAQIYQKLVKKYISPRYLRKFIEGDKNPTGQRQGVHSPVQMFDAVAEAIQQRQQTERDQTAKALKILQTKIQIPKPQPIAQ